MNIYKSKKNVKSKFSKKKTMKKNKKNSNIKMSGGSFTSAPLTTTSTHNFLVTNIPERLARLKAVKNEKLKTLGWFNSFKVKSKYREEKRKLQEILSKSTKELSTQDQILSKVSKLASKEGVPLGSIPGRYPQPGAEPTLPRSQARVTQGQLNAAAKYQQEQQISQPSPTKSFQLPSINWKKQSYQPSYKRK